MASAIDPFSVSNLEEIRILRMENASLRTEIEGLRKDIASFQDTVFREIALDRQRIRELEGAKVIESRAVLRHLDTIVSWLQEHEGRDGITYEEAAKLLNVTPERISQLIPSMKADGRLQVAKHKGRYRKKFIELV